MKESLDNAGGLAGQDSIKRTPSDESPYYINKGLFYDSFLKKLEDLDSTAIAPKVDQRLLDYWYRNTKKEDAEFQRAYKLISDKWSGWSKSAPNMEEADLERELIDPILEVLGWHPHYQKAFRKLGKLQKPDYVFFTSSKEKEDSYELLGNIKDKKASWDEYFGNATAIADAKKWLVSLDGTKNDNSNPGYQITAYLRDSGKQWGIVSNGRYWRLYSTRREGTGLTYFEIDLHAIVASHDLENFRLFYNFFSKHAFDRQTFITKSFLDYLYERGADLATLATKELKKAVFPAVESISSGYVASGKFKQDSLGKVYKHSMYFIFRLMFILNCEAKGILNLDRKNTYYRHSIRKLLQDLFDCGPNPTWSKSTTTTYRQLLDLFRLLEEGDSQIGVPKFGSEVFTNGDPSFYKSYEVSDFYLCTALLKLGSLRDDDGKLKFIDFERLSPDHLGSLFEDLLEYRLTFAEEDYADLNGNVQPLSKLKEMKRAKKPDRIIKRGEPILLDDNYERKDTGSFYTEDYVVNYMVEKTLAPLVEQRTPEQILKLSVVDPAMGSGHFLLGVVQYLERVIKKKLYRDTETFAQFNVDPKDLRTLILRNCVYGVDNNPIAVELAKFSLWVFSVRQGVEEPLEQISDQLRFGNALVRNSPQRSDNFKWGTEFKAVFAGGGFDAVVGNPPYVGESGHKELFEDIRSDSYAKPYYQGKMDLFYFFYHLALDISKPEGRIAFITTNYFRDADGASKLRNDLKQRSIPELFVNLNELKVFKGAKGQHSMITLLRKSSPTKKDGTKEVEVVWSNRKEDCSPELFEAVVRGNDQDTQYYRKPLSEVFDGDQAYIRITENRLGIPDLILKSSEDTIDTHFDVNQGVVSGCDYISSRNFEKLSNNKGIQDKDGIFVLDLKNPRDMTIVESLSKKDKTLLRPFFKNSDISKFWCKSEAEKFLIYVSKASVPNLSAFKGIVKHLDRFADILGDRREAKNERIRLHDLQWSREESLFTGPKLVLPYRSRMNQFAFSDIEWFCRSDSYMITTKPGTDASELHVLLAVLNSTPYFYWFINRLGTKGKIIEQFPNKLNKVPIPRLSSGEKEELGNLAEQVTEALSNAASSQEAQQLLETQKNALREIDDIVCRRLGITKVDKAAMQTDFEKRFESSQPDPAEDDRELA